MQDFKILILLDKLKPLFDKLGADYTVMRRILQVKLTMDGRKIPTVFAGSKVKTDNGNKFLKSLWVYSLMGLSIIPFIINQNNYIYQMSIVFTIIAFFIMTSLISDFSSVLLDVKDKAVIGIRPVNPITLRLAKTIHISLYMFFITGALAGPALLISLYTQGIIFFILFLLSIILLDMLIIVFTTLVYFLILRFFDGEKLKDIINFIQIILSAALLTGYQLLGGLFNAANLKAQFMPKWWQYLMVPVWFSAPFQMVKMSEVNLPYIILTIMAFVIPIASLLIYIRFIPIIEINLIKLNNNYGKNKKTKKEFARLLSYVLCRNKEERIFFKFTLDMIKNEREFKLKVYPSLVFSAFFPFIFLLQILKSSSIYEVSQGKAFLYIYFCGMMLPNVVHMLRYSEGYKGAWIYKALPVNNYKPVFKGTLKASITKLFLPMFLFQSIFITAVFGVRILPDILLVLSNMIILILLSFMLLPKSLPFSEALQSAQQENLGTNLILYIFIASLAGIHFIFTNINNGIYILLALSIILNFVLWGQF